MRGQADPTASVSNTMPSSNFGFNLPIHLGTLAYSVTGSEMIENYYGGSSLQSETAFSGNLAYLSKSDRDPFSMVYSGGYLLNASSSGHYSTTFQDLAFSQVLQTRTWTYVVSDAVSYLPGAPTTGLSGVAGVGDIGIPPVQTGIGPAQDILTNYSNRLSNGLSGSATWHAGPNLDMQGSGSWEVIHFDGSGNTGIDSNSYSGNFGPNYRIDVRNSVGANVYYSYSTYPTYNNYKIESEGLNLTYTRAWSRRLSTTLSFGPEITHGHTFSNIPAAVYFAGSATATYATRTTGFNAIYSRGVNPGSGVLFGALTDTVSVGMMRPLSRSWQLGVNADYSRNVGLAQYMGVTPNYTAEFGAVQVSHRLAETLSCYASYTLLHQSSQNNVGINAFNGTGNVIGFGITYAPAPLISGR
jgi:hypothetical protein